MTQQNYQLVHFELIFDLTILKGSTNPHPNPLDFSEYMLGDGKCYTVLIVYFSPPSPLANRIMVIEEYNKQYINTSLI